MGTDCLYLEALNYINLNGCLRHKVETGFNPIGRYVRLDSRKHNLVDVNLQLKKNIERQLKHLCSINITFQVISNI